MRKPTSRSGPSASSRKTDTVSDLNARSGRVAGVAFGAPGPRIDLDRVLESWRDGDTVGGAAVEAAPRKAPDRTVSLPDGTTISFTVAKATQPAD